MMFLKTFFWKQGAPSICAAAIYEVVTVATTGSVSNNSAGLQGHKCEFSIFDLSVLSWFISALVFYIDLSW